MGAWIISTPFCRHILSVQDPLVGVHLRHGPPFQNYLAQRVFRLMCLRGKHLLRVCRLGVRLCIATPRDVKLMCRSARFALHVHGYES